MSKIKRILIFNPFGIGDVLFSTPLIRNLKDNFSQLYLAYMCNNRAYPLLKNNPFLDEVIIFEKDQWRQLLKKSWFAFLKQYFLFLNYIRKKKFDIVFDLSLNSSYGLFLKIAGIKKRIGFNFKKRGRFLTDKLDIPDGYSQKHVARYYLDLLKFLNITPKEYRFDIFIQKDKTNKIEKILNSYIEKDIPLIIICPASGDSWGKSAYFKRWPEENFINLCNSLISRLAVKIILVGSKNEESISQYISERVKGKILNLCGKITLEELVILIDKSQLVITNDGGVFHIAVGLEKKTIVFFGPVDEKVYGPYPDSKNIVVFSKKTECRPCYRSFRFLGCQYDKKCLSEIDAHQVFLAAVDLLKK